MPLTWNDRAVLSFEPIQVGFATRHTVAAIRNYKKSSFNWDEDMEKEIARDVLRKHGGVCVPIFVPYSLFLTTSSH